MKVFEHLLPQPAFHLSTQMAAEFDALLAAAAPGDRIEYCLPYPKWQFLSYLCKSHGLMMHGSQTQGIAVVELRQAQDVKAFSAQQAIYATDDGIFAMFFAIVDRKNFSPLSLFDSCIEIHLPANLKMGPFYFFRSRTQPWRARRGAMGPCTFCRVQNFNKIRPSR